MAGARVLAPISIARGGKQYARTAFLALSFVRRLLLDLNFTADFDCLG
jgi:hypothetical protein